MGKPQLAEDAVLEEVRFPCWVQPKIDGVRALNRTGRITGRSLDEFKGFGISDYFSAPHFLAIDSNQEYAYLFKNGEWFVYDGDEGDPDACQRLALALVTERVTS